MTKTSLSSHFPTETKQIIKKKQLRKTLKFQILFQDWYISTIRDLPVYLAERRYVEFSKLIVLSSCGCDLLTVIE